MCSCDKVGQDVEGGHAAQRRLRVKGIQVETASTAVAIARLGGYSRDEDASIPHTSEKSTRIACTPQH